MLTAFVTQPLLATAEIEQWVQNALAERADTEALIRAAGRLLAKEITQQWPHAQCVAIFCGASNNGADGYSTALALQQLGVHAVLVPVSEALSSSQQRLRTECLEHGIEEQREVAVALERAELVVDAMLGNAAPNRMLPAAYIAALEAVNASGLPVLAVDLPTGVHGDTGYVHPSAVVATRTVAFVARRLAHVTGEAAHYCGTVVWYSLDVEVQNATKQALWVEQQQAAFLPPRATFAHKGTQGHLLVIAGGEGMGGAALLAAEAALRAGAGKVTVLTMAAHVGAFLARQPALMVRGVKEGECIKDWLAQADAVMIGSGLGLTQWGKLLWQQAITVSKPLLCDADALTWWQTLNAKPRASATVFTPHPGEAAHLLQCSTKTVQQNRYNALFELEKKLGGTVVLKGNGTMVSRAEKEPLVLNCGNPGMAVGGMGDVLSGIISALLCQGFSADTAAFYGAWWHGRAADKVVRERGEVGLLPTDVIVALPESHEPWVKK